MTALAGMSRLPFRRGSKHLTHLLAAVLGWIHLSASAGHLRDNPSAATTEVERGRLLARPSAPWVLIRVHVSLQVLLFTSELRCRAHSPGQP
ncbi:hypothetical protein SKAU_G00384920 [Synaphobranchus kaupii]|uniref:Secreted protein n=1 Tax=Synaphobranchus kaupii TaxID=118154 RepID=A0A9Q1EEE0_SYNKA|nr:hypothetical protein SKAU_G00384920 [Synaphobranchus kaupii]